MLFNSIEFAVFLPIVFLLYWLLNKNLKTQNVLIIMNSAIEGFCKSNANILYMNGEEDFDTVKGDDFMISKYDGHPNALAHKKIAERIEKDIIERVYH